MAYEDMQYCDALYVCDVWSEVRAHSVKISGSKNSFATPVSFLFRSSFMSRTSIELVGDDDGVVEVFDYCYIKRVFGLGDIAQSFSGTVSDQSKLTVKY